MTTKHLDAFRSTLMADMEQSGQKAIVADFLLRLTSPAGGLVAACSTLADAQSRIGAVRESLSEMLHSMAPATALELGENSVVDAQAWTDDNKLRASFNAAPWFVQADAGAIISLLAKDFSEVPDAIAEFCATFDSHVAAITNHPNTEFGYTCVVDEASAMRWLKEHRQETWARVLCEQNDVELEANNNEKSVSYGQWNWVAGTHESVGAGFPSVGAAALHAVEYLGLEPASDDDPSPSM
jgi:hypothetical protein